MRAKLIVDGHEFDIDILDPKLQALISPIKTGYEQVKAGKNFFAVRADGTIFEPTAGGKDNNYYDVANYYSDRTVAENNARADKLMRQLRRFAVNSRVDELDWHDNTQAKWTICHSSSDGIGVCQSRSSHCCGQIYFDRLIDAQKAIETFHDELTWYFAEYKDSL